MMAPSPWPRAGCECSDAKDACEVRCRWPRQHRRGRQRFAVDAEQEAPQGRLAWEPDVAVIGRRALDILLWTTEGDGNNSRPFGEGGCRDLVHRYLGRVVADVTVSSCLAITGVCDTACQPSASSAGEV